MKDAFGRVNYSERPFVICQYVLKKLYIFDLE